MTVPEYLMRLSLSAEALVSDEFLHDPELAPLSGADIADELQGRVPLAAFHESVSTWMNQPRDDPSAGDAELAVSIHKALSISLRLGMDPGIWHYLTCVARPDYVWVRWGGKRTVTRERFLGSIKRNAFARLWWCSEVMRDGDDYTGVATCFADQDMYEAVFGRAFSKFPSAAKVFVNTLGEQERRVVREVAKDFNLMLSTFVLEDMTDHQIRSLLEDRAEYRAR